MYPVEKYYDNYNARYKIFIKCYFQFRVKAKLHEMMQTDKDFVPEDEYKLNPCQQISIANSLKFIQNPVRCCKHMHYLIQEVNNIIEKKRSENESKGT